MKIDIVGSCCTWTKALSTSFIINDEILFDVPEGSFKSLLNDWDLSNIKFIVISHFHSDHFADIHLAFDYIFRKYPDHKLTVVAPKGCYERICGLFRLFEVAYLEEYLKERVTIIEVENNKKFKLGGYSFKCYRMTHGSLDAYGYVIDDGQIKVGFTGDSCLCNNVRKILKKSKECFIDSANLYQDNKHLSVNEVVLLGKEFPACKLHMVHLSNPAIKEIERLGLTYPKQGETILVN